MYLYDQVVQSSSVGPLVVVGGNGKRYPITGSPDMANAVRACSVRYILSDDVRDTCIEMMCTRAAVICPSTIVFRIPHESMWLEWIEPTASSNIKGRRVGLLVLASDSGRRGKIWSFWEEVGAVPVLSQTFFEFDLDNEISDGAINSGIEFRGGDGEGIRRIYRHADLVLGDDWKHYLNSVVKDSREFSSSLELMFKAVVTDFPFLCSFILLLSLERVLSERVSSLDKLNLARVKKGKPALLDHVELTLHVDQKVIERSKLSDKSRSAARLHQVRGHVVRRGEKVFWRANHLRGDATLGLLARRTVHVER